MKTLIMMRKIRKTLKAIIWLSVALALAIVVLFESHAMPSGLLAENSHQLFVATIVMELLSLALIPLAISLLRLPFVRKRLGDGQYSKYLMWSSVRIGLLAFLMVGNTLCYYLCAAVPFGYLAIIAFLCLMVVYPTNERCSHEMEHDNPSHP